MATKKDIKRWIRELSNPDIDVRAGATNALKEVAQDGMDITAAVPALAEVLFDEDWEVRENAVKALGEASEETDISAAAPALVKALFYDDITVSENAEGALRRACGIEKNRDCALNALLNALSDERFGVRGEVAEILERVAKKTDVGLGKVKKALTRFVENEGKKGTKERKEAEKEATERYLRIANAESKRRKAIGMAGVLLPDTIKAPKGPKMYRQRFRTQPV